ncbi:hypothetical protein [Bradyrhizobium centrosematis]|uniref:hypothetical protein n=1 Tax=Bradyrhizobium centrosematis TaxID=1300039 RepID=UPI00388E2402
MSADDWQIAQIPSDFIRLDLSDMPSNLALSAPAQFRIMGMSLSLKPCFAA